MFWWTEQRNSIFIKLLVWFRHLSFHLFQTNLHGSGKLGNCEVLVAVGGSMKDTKNVKRWKWNRIKSDDK